MCKKRMVVSTVMVVLLVVTALFSGCTGRVVSGAGEMVSQVFQVENFSAVNLNVPFVVVWQSGPQTVATIEMQENLFAHLQVSVENAVLVIESARSFDVAAPNTPRLYITSPRLIGLQSCTAVVAKGWDTVYAAEFTINLEGGGVLEIPLNVDLLAVDINEGGADLTLSGYATQANITVVGGVTLEALDLQTAETHIRLTGGGTVDIAVSDVLDVAITGAGFIRYRGSPVITQSITGFGSVSSAD